MKKRRWFLNITKMVVIITLAVLYILPLVFVVLNSFKTTNQIIAKPLSLPTHFSLTNYISAFNKMNYLHGFFNSLIITTFSVLIIVIFSSSTAYLFVRMKWKINKFIFFIMIGAMIIPFQGIMIPLVKIYGSLHMLNSKWALIYMYLGFGTSLAVFMYHGFIKSVPLELEEAAMIDGATRFQTFVKIVFPLLKSPTMTIVILDILWIWNDFLLPNLVLGTAETRTLPLSTYYFYGTYTTDYSLAMAGLILSVIPILIVYMFMQKHIIEGVMQGAIK